MPTTSAKLKCSRCATGELVPGFIEDKGVRTNMPASYVLSWVPGLANRTDRGTAEMEGRKRFDVSAYRCQSCGHLDLFVE